MSKYSTIAILLLSCFLFNINCTRNKDLCESNSNFQFEEFPYKRKIRKLDFKDIASISERSTYKDIEKKFGKGYYHMPIVYYPAKNSKNEYFHFAFKLDKKASHKLEVIYKGETGGANDIVVWPNNHKGKTVKQYLKEINE